MLFGNSGNYILYTNQGKNTLDGTPLEVNYNVLIKDAPTASKMFNGIYKILNVQEGANNTYVSRCVRVAEFKLQSDIVHAFVAVKPSGPLGGGLGSINSGLTFLCSEPKSVDDAFVLDTTDITFAGFGAGELRSMSKQDHDQVNITGGVINIPSIHTNYIQPRQDTTEVNVRLGGSTEYFKFQVQNDNGALFSVNGQGVATAQQFVEPSDRNLKKNDAKIYDAIELVRKLRGVTFDWIDGTRNRPNGAPNYGFIAQEVALHFPSLVHQRGDGYYAVDYSKVVAILVEAVKDIGNMLNM
jgi:hypothetical protein